MKKAKKLISLLLVVAMLLSTITATMFSAYGVESVVSSAASVQEALNLLTTGVDHECKTDCNGDCGYSPLIIVPGIMQSQVYVQNAEGTGDLLTVDGFPIVEGMDMQFMFDTKSIMQDLKKMILPLLKSIVLLRKAELIDQLCVIFDKCFYAHYFNEDGTRTYDVQVDEYWYSLAETMNRPEKSYNYAKGYSTDKHGNTLPTTKYKTEFDFIKRQVDISSFCEKAGYDHTYYYAYSSFGDTYEIARKLNDYVQMVKDQTGHDKVNIVFISLGGTIGNTYLADFCNPNDLDRVVFAAAAVDGSYLLSSLMDADTIMDSDDLYTTIFPDLMYLVQESQGGNMKWIGYLLNAVIRIIPKKFWTGFFTDLFKAAIDRVLGNMLYNCPSMWALVPSSEYVRMADKYIKSPVLREKTDRYYNIQKNAAKTLQKLTAQGKEIFVISGYNLPMPSILSCYAYSSDNIIQASSSSVGAVVAPYGQTLPANYVPVIDDSYISPNRELDAGAAALPDRTWFIRNQSHLTLQSAIHDTIELCVQLVTNKEIKDARVNNGGYAQFLEYRPTKRLMDMIDLYENGITPEQFAAVKPKKLEALKKAYENGKRVLDSKEWNYEEGLAAEKEMYTAMYNAKLLWNMSTADSPYKRYESGNNTEKVMKVFSDIVGKIFGKNDFIPFI